MGEEIDRVHILAGRIQTTEKLVQAANNGQNFAFTTRLAQEVDMNIPLREKNLNMN